MELSREIIQRMVGRVNGGSVTGGGSGGSSGGGEGGGGEGGGGGTSIVDWANITSKPTTISGYGITDAYISGGTIYLGGNSITPLVSGDLNGYATQQWVGQQGFLTSSAISDMATETWVQQQGYLTSSSISDMATKTWVGQQGYITSSAISDMATKTWVGQQGYITSSAISDMATKTWVGQQNYLTSSALSNYVQKSQTAGLLKNDGTVDTNTYLTSVPSNYLSVDNNGMLSHQIQTNDQLILYGTGNNFGELVISDAALYDVHYLSANANGKMTWDGNAVATETWVNSQGHVASAGALKYSGTAKVSAQNDGALVDGYLHIGNVSVAEGGSFTYYPTITFGDYNGMDVYIQEDSEDHMTIRASAGITLLDATTINDSLHFSPTVSGYDCQVGMYLSSTLFNFVSINGQQSISGYKFDAEVQAPSFKKNGSSDNDVLLGGGGTKEVIDFATWMDRPVTARGLNVAGDSTLAAPHVRMTYDYVSAGRFSMNFTGYAGDTMVAPISYIFDAPVTQSSDIRKKDIIRDEAFDAESIAKMPLVTFSWKKDERRRMHFGSIAQEWQKVLPEVVADGPDGMLAMDYGAAAMAAGVTACREIVRLKEEIERLKEMINNK